MIPPPWIAMFTAANVQGMNITKQMAQDLVSELEEMGYSIVPAYAVDASRIPQGVKLPDDQAGLDPRAWLSEEEIANVQKYFPED